MKEPSAGEREGDTPRRKEPSAGEREGDTPRRKEPSYWQENLRLVAGCLAVWFIVSFGFGLLLVDVLNEITFGGFQLGFWFAQQGSMYFFLPIIFFYAWRVTRLDRKYGMDESDEPDASTAREDQCR